MLRGAACVRTVVLHHQLVPAPPDQVAWIDDRPGPRSSHRLGAVVPFVRYFIFPPFLARPRRALARALRRDLGPGPPLHYHIPSWSDPHSPFIIMYSSEAFWMQLLHPNPFLGFCRGSELSTSSFGGTQQVVFGKSNRATSRRMHAPGVNVAV